MCDDALVDVIELGPLRVRRVVIGAEPADKSARIVLLMHGFGAPGDDLVPLAAELGCPPGTTILFPEAPLDLGALHPMFGAARAWWLIDMERMQLAIAQGEMRDLRHEIPEGLAEARAMLAEAMAEIDAERLVIGGFSQGAMLALDAALHSSRPLAGVVLLSGTLLAESVWVPRMKARAGLHVFQSHGTEDQILPYELAETLKGELENAGMKVEFRSFSGGHAIPPPVMRGLTAWLRDRVS